MSDLHAACLLECVRPVHDLARATAFYCQALGFSPSAAAPEAALASALAQAWGQEPHRMQRLQLGRETLLLAECSGWHSAPDAGAVDRRFQHIAVITFDMAAAWQRLQGHVGLWQPLSEGGPEALPAASGGAVVVKFHDPDGHPVELLAFAPERIPPRWQGSTGLSCGIDHSAITVSDTDRSIGFYQSCMGLLQGVRQVNRGPEQARLDGIAVPEVDVVALSAPQAGPHLELLGYRSAVMGRADAGPRTCTLWRQAADSGATAGTVVLSDPDGHTHLLLPPQDVSPS